MIFTALAAIALVIVLRLLPELRHVDEIQRASEGAEADTLAGVRSASSGAPGVSAPLGAPE